MAVIYRSIKKEGRAEQIIEKSKFIAHVKPVFSKEEGDTFVSEIKANNKAASHNVPAYVIGDKFQIQWASDDGEPQGTSGAPIVQMLVNEGITNVAVVITRYFGGVKLGTGGLVRAYTSSAKLGILEAGICKVEFRLVFMLKVDYTFLGKIENLARDGFFQLGEIIYEDKVIIPIIIELEKKEEMISLLENITGGKIQVLNEEIKKVEIDEV